VKRPEVEAAALPLLIKQRARQLNGVLAGFAPGELRFERAVRDTVETHPYAEADVRAQLQRIVRPEPEALRRLASSELAGCDGTVVVPNEILHLVAATVPGLVVESLLTGLYLGAHNQIRGSRRETVLDPFLDYLREAAPEHADQVRVVVDIDWRAPDAAIVYGSDDAVEMVRQRLDEPVAGYGSREGIAVVTPNAQDGWERLLARDIVMFAQRGCMSPSHVWLARGADAGQLAALAAAIRDALPNHITDVGAAAATARSIADAWMLGAMLGGHAPPDLLDAPAVAVQIHRADDDAELARDAARLSSKLQTAVLACDPRERRRLRPLLEDAGCSRVVEPGAAHQPAWDWRHDGLGRFAPLARRA
jgi:hypothetical protein